MEPYQLLEIKHSISGSLLVEALEEVSRIDTKKYKRVRIIFEYEFDDQGNAKDSVEIRYRRPWK